MDWLKKVWDRFVSFFSTSVQEKLFRSIRATAPYIEYALNLVELADKVNIGGRSAKKILDLASQWGVRQFISVDASDLELATALRDVVVKALQYKFPEASTSVLNRVVEICVGVLRER